MKKKILYKLRSQTGASITFALLLFLVCAVLCSVIITAVTASSGRMSGIAESDQRYYAVSSAAELLQDLIDGKTVSIVKVVETEYETTYTSGDAGVPVPKERHEPSTYIIEGSGIEDADLGSGNMIGGTGFVIDSIVKDAAKRISEYNNETTPLEHGKLLSSSSGDGGEGRFALISTFFSDAGLDYDSLAVTINEDLDVDGNITLTIYNTYNKGELSNEGNRYTMILPFGVDRSVSTSSKTENVSSMAGEDDETYTVVTKTTETTITTLTWNLNGIKTNS